MDTDPLALDREVESITKELAKEGIQDKFSFVEKKAVKADDVSLHFLEVEPDIVHFSGHGSRANQIYLLDENGKSVPVGTKVLSMLFKALRGKIRCVVLNACFSEVQALVISKYIDCVIGMSRSIGDEAAIKFAQGFYRGLGNGTEVKTAVDLGCFQIGAHFPEEHNTPQIIWKNDDPKKIVFGQLSLDLNPSDKKLVHSSALPTKKGKQIKDRLSRIYYRYKLDKMIEDYQESLAYATAYLWKAHESLFGEPPSPEDTKKLLAQLLMRSPQWFRCSLDPDLNSKRSRNTILRRFVDNAYEAAMELLKRWRYFDGI